MAYTQRALLNGSALPYLWNSLEEVQEFYQNINVTQLFQLIDNSYCSTLMKNAIKTLMAKRFEELKSELAN